jgi:hypothetical protein
MAQPWLLLLMSFSISTRIQFMTTICPFNEQVNNCLANSLISRFKFHMRLAHSSTVNTYTQLNPRDCLSPITLFAQNNITQ